MKVLVAFDDASLGGTSRTAVLFAQLWRGAGAEVMVYSPRQPHAERLAELRRDGIEYAPDQWRLSFAPNLVHLHHAAPSPSTVNWVRDLLQEIGDEPAVLTHNIFGQELPLKFPRETVVGVLGNWLSTQYEFQARQQHPVRIMPNPQNFSFFRPPSPSERAEARSRLQISEDAHVILRVGSPSLEKWSVKGYSRLKESIASSEREIQLRLIGVPHPVAEAARGSRTFTLTVPKSSDTDLRDEYWSADAFAHWAERGESFGNVILEAMGTGLHVIYKSRETRDNTPAEFRGLSSFSYTKSPREWLRASIDENGNGHSAHALEADENLHKYSADHMLKTLRDIVRGSDAGLSTFDLILENLELPRQNSWRERWIIRLRHNFLSARVKRIKHNLVHLRRLR